jgi:hypothetical protein
MKTNVVPNWLSSKPRDRARLSAKEPFDGIDFAIFETRLIGTEFGSTFIPAGVSVCIAQYFSHHAAPA